MRHAIPRFSSLAVSLGITGLFAIGYSADVRAQTIFCPTFFSGSSSSSGSPVVLLNGSCTDRVDGAFSGAAVASQALTELSQTTTETSTKEVGKAIVERREQERERMRRPVRPARSPVGKAEASRGGKAETSCGHAQGAPVTFTDRACRPICDLDSSLWRLSDEGRCWT